MVVYTLMGLYSFLALPVIYLIPLIERLICRCVFIIIRIALHGYLVGEMISFEHHGSRFSFFYMEGLGGDTIYGC